MSDDNMRQVDRAWQTIFSKCKIDKHNFDESPCAITANEIKIACQHFTKTGEKEARILCKQDTREKRPIIFQERDLFVLPVINGAYCLIRGEGYVDIPEINSKSITYSSKLDFTLDMAKVGNSEMQHLDYAYALSMVRHFMDDDSLVLAIRGRKFSPNFSFRVGKHHINVKSVQTEVDSGYEGRNKVVLIEAKNSATQNTIIRQLYYPYRQWSNYTKKPVSAVFFEKHAKTGEYHFWEFIFTDNMNYNSIKLKRSAKYKLAE